MFKKIIIILFTFFLQNSIFANDYDFEIGGFYYRITSESNSEVCVTNPTAWDTLERVSTYSGNWTIPSSVVYNGKTYTVSSIDEFAFRSCGMMTSISIPSSIKEIGEEAFVQTDLETVAIPNSVTKLGKTIFSNCFKLKKVTLPDNLKSIPHFIFGECPELEGVLIPSSVTKIEYGAFAGCSKITSITIPSNVTYIGPIAFNRSGLTSITLPSSVKTIEYNAFSRCSNLSDVYSYIYSPFIIGENAFLYISSDATLHIPKGTRNLYQDKGWCSYFANTVEDIDNPNQSSTTYTLSISASGNGSASFNGESIRGGGKAFTVNEGTKATISFSPDNGYQVKSVKVNGSSVSASSSYTVTVNSNTTVSVEFEAKPDDTPITPTYTLSVSASGGGSASYGGTSIRGTTSTFTLNEGTSATVSFNPDDGYRIASVKVNGSSVSTSSSVTVTMNTNTTVAVVFEEIPVVTYTMTVTSKGNGEAAYNGSSVRDGSREFTVNEGSSPRVTFSPDLGNRTKIVKLNGSEVSFSDNRYTISNVRSDNTLEVEFEELESKFSSGALNYEVSSFENMAVKIGMGEFGLSIEVPDKVENQGVDYKIEGITDEAMSANKDLAAIIWNPENVGSFKTNNPNMLLYIKDAKYAPSNINNVVVGDVAESIILAESQSGNNFYCPKAFTAKKIAYSHRYRMRTGGGESKGWETIALPFDVQKIEHVEEGEIVPFSKWSSTSVGKPFWLYQLSTSGFVEADGIKANTPYVISMPNNDVYQNDYILRGTVTFSATNVEVKKSDDVQRVRYGNRTFVPNFINLENNAGYYALNVNNDIEVYQGSENEGSVFIQDLRRIHPFEAYMTSTAATRSIGIFDGMTTAIKGINDIENGSQTLKVYNLNGQCIKTGTSMESLKQELPAGLYIINNKKVIIR